MKKIILTSTALLAFAAASYAQLIQQNGQQQFARQNQVGPNQNGTIEQRQNATPALNGVNYGNYAITFQGTPANNGANVLLIQQNDGSQGNRAGISQSGGPGLNATIQQNGGVDGLSGGATSTSATQSARGEDGNFAGILQMGSNSTATITESNNSRRNSAETYQNGSNNTANTSQSNNSVSNNAFIFQGFTGQNIMGTAVNNAVATIRQGKVNAGDMVPGLTPEAVSSTAVITQTASNVTATITQGSASTFPGAITPGRASGVTASVIQAAIQNLARVNQGIEGGEATGSRATVTQASQGNEANVYQGFGVGSSNNESTVTITQSGVAGSVTNVATVFQGAGGAADRSQATITQTSTANTVGAGIRQGLNSNSSGDVATISQSGQSINATISQQTTNAAGPSTGRDNNASIIQGTGVVGNGTTTGLAVIFQGNATGSILQTSRNTATVNQVTGVGLRASIVQGASAGTPLTDAAGSNVGLTALQGGAVTLAGTLTNDNTASLNQLSGDNHNANIFQTGRFNSAAITQSNGNGSQALVVQTANSERAQAIINQTANGAINNQATILQFAGSNADGRGSFGNQAIINQTVGSNNVAFIQQGQQGAGGNVSSNDNFAQITQNGSTNQARFLQIGNNNFVDITQNGNNNQILNAAGAAGSFGAQIGYNNRLTLVQNGGTVGLSFRYTQIGNNNTQEVVQNLNP